MIDCMSNWPLAFTLVALGLASFTCICLAIFKGS